MQISNESGPTNSIEFQEYEETGNEKRRQRLTLSCTLLVQLLSKYLKKALSERWVGFGLLSVI
jgi:hypothetical protein